MVRPHNQHSPVRTDRSGEGLVRARTSFLVDDKVEAGTVRDTILASWTRSREWDVDTDSVEMSCEYDTDSDSPLSRAAAPIIADVADELGDEPVSVILTDAEGVVLERRTGDSTLNQHLDKVWLAPGFSYAEKFIGTNGIGTALEGRGPVQVFGHEHYVPHLADLACAGAPIWHPVSGKLMGVIDLTCWRPDAGRFMSTAVERIARQIEGALLDQSGPRELALLHDYLAACRRNRGAVFAISPDLVMTNDRARELIDPADQDTLVAGASEAMNNGRRLLMVDLPSGAIARVHVRPSWIERGESGGVLQVQLAAPDIAAKSSRTPAVAPVNTLPAAVGSGLLWTKCCQAVDRHFHSREWIILEGEPGTGRTTIARATHQMRTPAAHLRLLDADDYGPEWIADIVEELETGGGTLVISHIDRLDTAARQALADALEPRRDTTDPDRPWVVATADVGGLSGDAGADLLEFFPRTVEVPPLRHHVEDVAELVPHLIARLTRGSELTCSPEAMRVLMRNRWPGNVEQLYQVLRKTVARRRAGVLQPSDLPPETRAITRRVLTPLEAIECDAIVDALLDNNGNKAEAARHLGMSRATIYRKIRGYGISTPESGN